MTALIVNLETDLCALWRHYNGIRSTFLVHPTPALMDERLEAFKPYCIKLVGKGWEKVLPVAMERERRSCVAALNAARLSDGGRFG